MKKELITQTVTGSVLFQVFKNKSKGEPTVLRIKKNNLVKRFVGRTVQRDADKINLFLDKIKAKETTEGNYVADLNDFLNGLEVFPPVVRYAKS